MKLRANIETEYNNLRAENERLVYEAMLALLLLTYYRGIDTGRKMEQAKAEGKQTA